MFHNTLSNVASTNDNSGVYGVGTIDTSMRVRAVACARHTHAHHDAHRARVLECEFNHMVHRCRFMLANPLAEVCQEIHVLNKRKSDVGCDVVHTMRTLVDCYSRMLGGHDGNYNVARDWTGLIIYTTLLYN